MSFLRRYLSLRTLVILWAVYAMVWISLEGNYVRVLILSVWGLFLLIGSAIWRRFGTKPPSLARWLLVWALAGLLAGGLTPPVTFALMAVKTGLHAHGPEFSAQEIALLWQSWPVWLLASPLLGIGLGLLSAGWSGR